MSDIDRIESMTKEEVHAELERLGYDPSNCMNRMFSRMAEKLAAAAERERVLRSVLREAEEHLRSVTPKWVNKRMADRLRDALRQYDEQNEEAKAADEIERLQEELAASAKRELALGEAVEEVYAHRDSQAMPLHLRHLFDVCRQALEQTQTQRTENRDEPR